MKTIPAETINKIWNHFYELSEEEAQQVTQLGQERQPFILVYLLAMDESIMDKNEKGLLIELGGYVLEIMYAAKPNLRRVTDQDLDTAEAANFKLLEDLDAGREMDYVSAVQKLMQNYNQMPLLGAVLEALMSGHEEEPDLAPEHVGLALLTLKTVIDCLDQA
jgi:hypothetical protein